MKNKMMNVMMIASLMGATASTALAKEGKHHPKSVEARVEKQEKRIDRKLKKGKINQDQANALKSDVQKVENDKKAMEAKDGGKLTKEDRKTLQKELNNTSKEIKAAGKGSSQPAQAAAPSNQ